MFTVLNMSKIEYKFAGQKGGRISKIKSPFTPQDNPIVAGDTVQIAFEKTQGQINNLAKAEVYLGNWNALTNIPTLPLIPTSPTYKSGEYYRVSVSGTFNGVDYTVGDKIVVSTDKSTNTLFWELENFDNENKQDKIFTYTVADLTELNAITGMIAGDTAITLDTLTEYIYITQWEEVLQRLANKNQVNGYAGLDSDTSILATQIDKPLLNYLPRVFYGFYIDGGVATFDNGANTILKNQLLLCTKTGTVGAITYTKGYIYQINQDTATPDDTMLTEFLTVSQCVGKMLFLDRAFNDNLGAVYSRGIYKTNIAVDDLELINAIEINIDDTIMVSGAKNQQEFNEFINLTKVNVSDLQQPFKKTFNATTDWGSASGGKYTITVLATEHGFSNLYSVVNIYKITGGIREPIYSYTIDDITGDLSFSVLETPDGRFAGELVIGTPNAYKIINDGVDIQYYKLNSQPITADGTIRVHNEDDGSGGGKLVIEEKDGVSWNVISEIN